MTSSPPANESNDSFAFANEAYALEMMERIYKERKILFDELITDGFNIGPIDNTHLIIFELKTTAGFIINKILMANPVNVKYIYRVAYELLKKINLNHDEYYVSDEYDNPFDIQGKLYGPFTKVYISKLK